MNLDPIEIPMSEKKTKKNPPAPKFDHASIPQGEERMVPVKDLLLSKTFQPRSGLDEETIEEYAEEIKSGDFPCIEVVVVEDKMYVVDGFHRVEAAREAKLKDIRAVVRNGSKHLAQWMAACSNRKHGLRRTNADKRRAVKMALQAAPNASLREVAEHCGVSHELVRLVKDPPAQDKPKAPREEKTGPKDVLPPTPQGQHDPKSKENARQVLVGLLGECETLRARFNAVAKTPAGTFLSMQTAMSEIDNLKSCIKSALPHGLCIYCNGEGCTNCKKLGWMSERMFATAPKSLKSGTK